MSLLAQVTSPLSLGPVVFGAPLALAALIALPVIWFVLRATPPAPRNQDLPSLRLLDDLKPREETPDRTPWWVLLLRLLAAAAAIIGLAQPVYGPAGPPETQPSGPLLVVVDDGWAAAPRWSDILAAAEAAVDASGRDRAVHLLLTAPRARPLTDPARRRSQQEAERALDTLEPASWATDRADALERLEASGLQPSRIFYASHGLTDGTDGAFLEGLAALAPLDVYVAPPRATLAITSLSSDGSGVSVTLSRVNREDPLDVAASAHTVDGAALATAQASFEAGSTETTARFDLPGGALSRVSRFSVAGMQGAGTTWLWDSADRTRRVGIVSTGAAAQPLLSDIHYVRRALEPFATLLEGDLADLIQQRPDAIILTDVGTVPATEMEPLVEWIEQGGALIRFAGPRLAAQDDELLPVPLRRTSRALGGALAWDDPQALAPFSDTSPFAGLAVPDDALVRQQVLAQPAADLQARTWARLQDGSPIVTANGRGRGMVVLFHVTAGPDWSDLPFSATYAQMLRRAIAAGRGEVADDGEGSFVPQLVLDGYGRLQSPGSTAEPLQAAEFATIQPGPIHPPGFYRGPSGTRAINAAAGARLAPISAWPAGTRLLGDAEARRLDLTGLLLTGALILIALDLLIALILSGRMPRLPRKAMAALPLLLALAVALPHPAEAQMLSARGEEALTKAEAAAINMRLGYIQTPDAELNRRTEAGLVGLSRILWLRSSVEPVRPHALDPERDALELYPLIYYSVPENAAPLSEPAIAALNRYMLGGGALMIDTRSGSTPGDSQGLESLSGLLTGLDAPPLAPVPDEHVLTRSFYLISDFPGRYSRRPLWIETAGEEGRVSGDGVSRLFIGDADWVGAWAIDENARSMFSVDGGDDQREMAYRFGVNLVMYVLTGNYKSDQVHIPALLERLGEDEEGGEDIDIDSLPTLQDGGPN
ncbi:MAG: DUF4159 domain-containing protein [Hyphomonadaceae bacterium]|nr:DUF4159 domain-containing protein [Hyphomonadaceae bacterium]